MIAPFGIFQQAFQEIQFCPFLEVAWRLFKFRLTISTLISWVDIGGRAGGIFTGPSALLLDGTFVDHCWSIGPHGTF